MLIIGFIVIIFNPFYLTDCLDSHGILFLPSGQTQAQSCCSQNNFKQLAECNGQPNEKYYFLTRAITRVITRVIALRVACHFADSTSRRIAYNCIILMLFKMNTKY